MDELFRYIKRVDGAAKRVDGSISRWFNDLNSLMESMYDTLEEKENLSKDEIVERLNRFTRDLDDVVDDIKLF